MKIYVGFDDTDVLNAEMGTGKLVRLFAKRLPPGAQMWGVVRHQLLVDPRIPFTSHNSSACAIVEADDPGLTSTIRDVAAEHIAEMACEGSDPGLCVATEDDRLDAVKEFGVACASVIETQRNATAVAAAARVHLSGHGGTNDGIIGALAAVGLTAHGWSGRFIERGDLRAIPDPVTAADLMARGIVPVAIERDAAVLPPSANIQTNGWLRPRLCAGQAVLPVRLVEGVWTTFGSKRRATAACPA